MNLNLNEQYKFVQVQMAAEAFLKLDRKIVAASEFIDALTTGNGYSSKFTLDEAEHFTKHWSVIDQVETKTGFSGTLFKCVISDPATGALKNELVMSFRSTEFVEDAVRDNIATNELEIKETGWAWGQLRDMDACTQSCAAILLCWEEKSFPSRNTVAAAILPPRSTTCMQRKRQRS